MTQKQLVLNAINDLPNDAPLSEIVDRIEFLAQFRRAWINSIRARACPMTKSNGNWPHGLPNNLVTRLT